jgi:hypothetical protein
MAADGTLYGGDLEHGGIVALRSDHGHIRSHMLPGTQTRIAWGDSFSIAGGALWVADARLSNWSLPITCPGAARPRSTASNCLECKQAGIGARPAQSSTIARTEAPTMLPTEGPTPLNMVIQQADHRRAQSQPDKAVEEQEDG